MTTPDGRPIRVCHIAATTEGAAWVHEQLRDLRDRYGFEVSVILNGTTGGLVDRFRASGIRVLHSDFDFTSSIQLLTLPRKVLALWRILKRERFDVIQTHLFHSMVIGRIAAWFADVPLRLSMIAGPFHLEAWTPRWIDRWTGWMEDAVISSCEFTRALYRGMGVPYRRIELVYYGPDPTRFDPAAVTPARLRAECGWAAEAPLIGMVAYFYPELPVNRWIPSAVQGQAIKRQEDFIRAARLILDNRPEVRFVLVGKGWEAGGEAYMARMQALATELGLGGALRFTGFRTDIPAVLRSLDAAVQASVSENLGGTIESLLMECPTVATRVGGMVDSVIDGKTGVLVAPRDPTDLARGILRLLDDRDGARRMAARGRTWMLERFTLDRTVDELAAIYRRRLARRPRGYRPAVSLLRFTFGPLVCAAIVARFVLLDLMLVPRWDAGWRPWTVWRVRAMNIGFRIKHHLVLPAWRAISVHAARAAQAARNAGAKMGSRSAAASDSAAQLASRACSAVGAATDVATPALGAARRRIATTREQATQALRAAQAAAEAKLRPAPRPAPPPHIPVPSRTRIWLWRFYAFVGRHAPRGNRARLRAHLARLRRR